MMFRHHQPACSSLMAWSPSLPLYSKTQCSFHSQSVPVHFSRGKTASSLPHSTKSWLVSQLPQPCFASVISTGMLNLAHQTSICSMLSTRLVLTSVSLLRASKGLSLIYAPCRNKELIDLQAMYDEGIKRSAEYARAELGDAILGSQLAPTV